VNRPPPLTSIGAEQLSPATVPPLVHVPPTQDSVVLHAVVHEPQWLRSELRSTQ
jgi:hypothetical protein